MNRRGQVRRTLTVLIALLLVFALIGCAKTPATGGSESSGNSSGNTPETKKEPIRWKCQSYAGSALNEHVAKNAILEFNKAANGEMVIDIYSADELVPQAELFRALKDGTVDMVVSDDDSMASPVDVAVFAAYFPLAARVGLDVNVLWKWYGLDQIWKEAYDEVGVQWLSQGSWDPCNIASTKPIHHLSDLKGLRLYMFPTGGKFMQRFGIVPVTLPYEDVQMAVQTGQLDGVAWSGITEDYTVGWADVCKYYLTNPLSGGWSGGWFANKKSWDSLPEHLKAMLMLAIEKSHYYRLHWYWWGEAHYRAKGGKLQLTTIPDEEWEVVEKEALKFWDEIAQKSPRCAKVVSILKEYAEVMDKAGPPYR